MSRYGMYSFTEYLEEAAAPKYITIADAMDAARKSLNTHFANFIKDGWTITDYVYHYSSDNFDSPRVLLMPPVGHKYHRNDHEYALVNIVFFPPYAGKHSYSASTMDAIRTGKIPGITLNTLDYVSMEIDFPDRTLLTKENYALFKNLTKDIVKAVGKRVRPGSPKNYKGIKLLPEDKILEKSIADDTSAAIAPVKPVRRTRRSTTASKVTDRRFNSSECEAIIQLNELAKAAYTSFARDLKKEFGALIKYNHDNPNSKAMAWLINKQWKNPFDKVLGKNNLNYVSGSSASYIYSYCQDAQSQFEKYQTEYNSAIKWNDSVDNIEALDYKYGDMISDEVIKIVGEIGDKYRGHTHPWEKPTSAYRKLQKLLSKIDDETEHYYTLYDELANPKDDPYEHFGTYRKFIEIPGDLDLRGIKWLIEKTDKYMK